MLYDKLLHVDWIAKLRIFVCLLFGVLGYTILQTQVYADELHGQLRWDSSLPFGGSEGYYLRQLDSGGVEIEYYQRNEGVTEGLATVGQWGDDRLPDRPGEVDVIISNHSEAPLSGSRVTIYVVQIKKYLIAGFTVYWEPFFVDEPGDFRWHFSGRSDDGAVAFSVEGENKALRVAMKDDPRLSVYPPEDQMPNDYSISEARIHPLPQDRRIVPNVLYFEAHHAATMITQAGLVAQIIPQETYDPNRIGRVTIQDPEYWQVVPFGTMVNIGVPQQVTQTIVPNIIGLHYEDAIAQLQAAGLVFEHGSTLTDDASRWHTVASVYYDYMGHSINLFETNYPDLRDGETVIVKQGSVVEVRIFGNPAANSESAVSSTNIEGTSGDGFAVPSMQVALMAPNGSHYVTAPGDRTSLSANVTWIRGWEQFQVETLDGLPMRSGAEVSIRTAHGKYWMARPNGSLTADAAQVSGWEAFRIYKIDGADGDPIVAGDQVAFLGFHGKWVSASGAGGGGIAANGPRVGGWEKFTLVPPQ